MQKKCKYEHTMNAIPKPQSTKTLDGLICHWNRIKKKKERYYTDLWQKCQHIFK